MIYALVTCAPCQAPSSSCSLNRRTYSPKVSSTRLLKAPLYPFHFPLRFAPLARVIIGAVSYCWFREFRKRSLDVYRGYVPRISGVAAMAAVDVNQPRAKGDTTGSSGRSCATEHRRLAGGGIGVTTGGRHAT
jgi:hypothetical protein